MDIGWEYKYEHRLRTPLKCTAEIHELSQGDFDMLLLISVHFKYLRIIHIFRNDSSENHFSVAFETTKTEVSFLGTPFTDMGELQSQHG